eukprot:GHVU01138831.1.p1 GENE.GHVU01138831.1~~GHVU01138831.1.p1  ORF type:complete len:321 (-),score=31.21 GHVU01138831.1:746-1708(-)
MAEQKTPRWEVTVTVPATCANLGPGFDCLGVALADVKNVLHVKKSSCFNFTVAGEGAEYLPRDESNLACVAASKAFQQLGREPPPLDYHYESCIPVGRGLGSSSAAIVAGYLAGASLAGGDPTDLQSAFAACSEIEGHPDNVGPTVFGGWQISLTLDPSEITSGKNETKFLARAIPVGAKLSCVIFVPDTVSETKSTRAILPSQVSHADAVFNLSRTALLVNALATGAAADLVEAMKDRLHQDRRASAHSHISKMINSAREHKVGACLSGAGPSILALCNDSGTAEVIATAFREDAKESGTVGRVIVTSSSSQGAFVEIG